MIEISDLCKSYGKKKALDKVSFTVNDGEVVGFLGPNGAGKSTTMNIITGYIPYDSGSVKIDGTDILEDPRSVKKKIGYLPETPPLYTDMTVWDYLEFVYDLKKVKEKNKKEHIQTIADETGIDAVKKRRIANLSKGYKQRVGLAGALIGDPKTLILDEPTVGLDPKQIIDIRDLIKELGKKRTVILSSHILQEINAVCERVIIINNGRIAAEDRVNNLKHNKNDTMILRVAGEKGAIRAAFEEMEEIASIKELGENAEGSFDFEIRVKEGAGSEFNKKLFFAFAEKKLPILMQKSAQVSLEQAFLDITKEENQ